MLPLLSLLLLQGVLGQDCPRSELQAMQDCVSGNFPELPELTADEVNGKVAAIFATAQECIEQVPECVPNEKDVLEAMEKMEKMKDVMECKRNVFLEKIRPPMETCMGDIPLPPVDKAFKVAFAIRMVMKHKKIFKKKLMTFCGGDRSKVKDFLKCMKEKKDDTDELGIKGVMKKLKPCFKGRMNCKKMVVEKLCDCAKQTFFDNEELKEELKSAAQECLTQAGIEVDPDEEKKLFGAPKKICMLVKLVGGPPPFGGPPPDGPPDDVIDKVLETLDNGDE